MNEKEVILDTETKIETSVTKYIKLIFFIATGLLSVVISIYTAYTKDQSVRADKIYSDLGYSKSEMDKRFNEMLEKKIYEKDKAELEARLRNIQQDTSQSLQEINSKLHTVDEMNASLKAVSVNMIYLQEIIINSLKKDSNSKRKE